MSARTPRRSFATPFVVTLAAVPACYVQTSNGPSSPPPTQVAGEPPPSSQPPPSSESPPVVVNPPRPGTTPAASEPPPSTPPPVIVNPPRPGTTDPTRPEPRPSGPPTQPKPPVIANPPVPNDPRTQTSPQQTSPQQTSVSQWTVFKQNDGCMAAIKVECTPKATCNPPPPFKIACYENVNLDKPVTVTSNDGGTTCFVDAPKCPRNAKCTPTRPQQVTCPTR
jgi:hypothetical protein